MAQGKTETLDGMNTGSTSPSAKEMLVEHHHAENLFAGVVNAAAIERRLAAVEHPIIADHSGNA